jgi:hypothetical protein
MRLGRIAARVGSVQLRQGYQKKGRKTSRRASSNTEEIPPEAKWKNECHQYHNATVDIGIPWSY